MKHTNYREFLSSARTSILIFAVSSIVAAGGAGRNRVASLNAVEHHRQVDLFHPLVPRGTGNSSGSASVAPGTRRQLVLWQENAVQFGDLDFIFTGK
jgi:hypothetical protein